MIGIRIKRQNGLATPERSDRLWARFDDAQPCPRRPSSTLNVCFVVAINVESIVSDDVKLFCAIVFVTCCIDVSIPSSIVLYGFWSSKSYPGSAGNAIYRQNVGQKLRMRSIEWNLMCLFALSSDVLEDYRITVAPESAPSAILWHTVRFPEPHQLQQRS